MADYAVIIMSKIGCDKSVFYSTKQLASITNLNLPTVRRILQQLITNKLVQAKRGSLGGYFLLRDMSKISMAEVIEAIDGPIALTDCCADGVGTCSSINCDIHGYWNKINQIVKDSLSAVTLYELVNTKHNQENKNYVR